MKPNATRLKEILTSDKNIGYFALLRLDWNATRYLTSMPHDITWNGNVYVSDTTIMEFQSPRYSDVVDREAYTLTLSGMDGQIHNEVTTGIIHRPVDIRLGFTLDGEPQLGLNDTMHVYSGTVANAKYVADAADEKMIWEIECSAPLSNLDAISTIFTTKDSIKNLFPGDTCFDGIQENNQKSTVAWGKT